MWIFFNTGFISVVQDRDDLNRLIVRARRPEILSTAFPNEAIKVSDRSDYRFRVFVSRRQLGEALCRAIVAIDYPNFKSSVNDPELNDLYNEIWALGLEYQLP